MFDILQLNDMLVPELKELAENMGLTGYKRLNKQELIHKILDHQAVVGASGKENGAAEKPTQEKEKPKRERARRKVSAKKEKETPEPAKDSQEPEEVEAAPEKQENPEDERAARRARAVRKRGENKQSDRGGDNNNNEERGNDRRRGNERAARRRGTPRVSRAGCAPAAWCRARAPSRPGRRRRLQGKSSTSA